MVRTMSLLDAIPARPDPDSLYEAFTGWVAGEGITLYPHQDEAAIELFTGNNVIVATPTGSGKSMIALAAHFAALAENRVTFYTAPIKALVSEKFFALCSVFGAENVGMLTGDASVNPDAPVICCTAEVLANLALREGSAADIGQVVMDEFHYYAEPERGWAWQVPLLTLPQAQFVLMSATLGNVDRFITDLTARTGRETAHVSDAERPVPLTFQWSLDPLHELLDELVSTRQVPAYVVHFTQAAALERAKSLLSSKLVGKDERQAIADEIGAFRFTAGFGRTLSKLVRNGIGVHHAGMLPRYRRLVEQLAQAGLLKVICGTDTLGVGINVPIRTVVFTGLAKFDGSRNRIIRAREFHQIAGRAGRAGFDSAGTVVVQAPEHVIENERALAKAGDDPAKRRKVQRKKPPDGFVSWTEETFDKLVAADPEPLVSRMRMTHSMILNVIERPGNPFDNLRSLVLDNHEERAGKRRLVKRTVSLARGLLESGVLVRLPEPDADGRTVMLAEALQDDFALNQPLSPFALAAFDLLDAESPDYALDLVSVIEAILDNPNPILFAQQRKARGEAIAELKADGVDYTERMAIVDEISWPKPLEELLEPMLEVFATTHPWVAEAELSPKSVVREMYEQGMGFTDLISRYEVQRSEGLVLRYLSDAYRALRQTVPESRRTPEFDDIVEWLGETVRQTDSSLLDEWEALTDPELVAARAEDFAAGKPPPPPRPITAHERTFTTMIRNAMWHRVQLIADDRWADLGRLEIETADRTDPPGDVVMTPEAWDDALGAYWDEHDDIGLGADARGPAFFLVTPWDKAGRGWNVRQVIDDPEGNRDWSIHAEVDLDASDSAGAPALTVLSFGRMD
ncbi:DEAD/DEAH box helicase [Enemella sp. A6]|uniref:DEAD/DEAH box helicase n=1 Tax=Enemella sp. A6 TaxID=3440152 RepID=UPI003EBFA818